MNSRSCALRASPCHLTSSDSRIEVFWHEHAGYLAHGTATDYMYEELKVPLSFTWEIFGDLTAHYNDCFRMFNPLTPEHLQQVTLLQCNHMRAEALFCTSACLK